VQPKTIGIRVIPRLYRAAHAHMIANGVPQPCLDEQGEV